MWIIQYETSHLPELLIIQFDAPLAYLADTVCGSYNMRPHAYLYCIHLMPARLSSGRQQREDAAHGVPGHRQHHSSTRLGQQQQLGDDRLPDLGHGGVHLRECVAVWLCSCVCFRGLREFIRCSTLQDEY